MLAIFRFVILRHIHRTRAVFINKSGGCVDPGLHSVLIKIEFILGYLAYSCGTYTILYSWLQAKKVLIKINCLYINYGYRVTVHIRKGVRVHIITFRGTTRMQSKSNRYI